MKTAFLLLLLFLAGITTTSCTNDEGDEGFDLLTPEEEEALYRNIRGKEME